MDFAEIKKMYNDARIKERNKISKFFREHKDFETENPSARKGCQKYTSGGRLLEKYDLSNWQWICIKRNSVNFFISLQSFESDPKTGNLHVLMDRIGIYAYVGAYSPIEAQTKMMTTNIELPVDDTNLNDLAKILKDLSECEIYRIQAQFDKVCSNYNLI